MHIPFSGGGEDVLLLPSLEPPSFSMASGSMTSTAEKDQR